MLTEAFPILSTPDLARSLAFYRDLLGCPVAYRFPDEGDPVFVTLEVGASTLGIGQDAAAAGMSAGRIELCAYTDDCDVTVERLRASGVAVLEEPADQPWGERMARVADPDGNRIVLLSALGQRSGR